MRIATIGGGPAGLYFAILMKKARPDVEIEIFERNGPDDTFGWGVVFSDETLGNFEESDPETFAAITARFERWTDIDTFVGGSKVTSTGHGFCGLGRRELLHILQARCRELGVRLRFDTEVTDVASLKDRDLLIGADGVNSRVRERWKDRFRPALDWRKCKFCWLGTDLEMSAFTFIFEESPWGLFQVHAYPFAEGRGTFIVECREETWRNAGLEGADEERTVAFCEELFAAHLKGSRLFTNRSIWRTFPTVTCESWRHENVVLLGDAAHTAHFSIGSGTKLAMEDAIALAEAFARLGTDDVPAVLEAYQDERYVDVLKTQKAAQTSLEWFENSARYLEQDPVTFTFNLMTRSKRITYENLEDRDPDLVAMAREQFRRREAGPLNAAGLAPDPVFVPLGLRGLELRNRIVVSPMCQYSAVEGLPSDWHLVHLGSRAVGGAGLVITEMTDVLPEGRITPGCTGLWNDEQTAAWARVVDFVHAHTGSRIGIQLAHAGRKGSAFHPWVGSDRPLTTAEGAWVTVGPSALPFAEGWPRPRELDRAGLDEIREAFVAATRRAEAAGFDLVELHLAHGYLLSSFLSPLSNRREDEYGGDLERRMRFPLEVVRAVRAAWPESRPLAARISATDWVGDEGMTPEDSVVLARALGEAGCDLIDVSTAGNSPVSRPIYGRMYQVPFAEKIRHATGLRVMAVGAIQNVDHANTILAAGRADLCALARPHLANPYLTLHAARDRAHTDQPWPLPYLPGR